MADQFEIFTARLVLRPPVQSDAARVAELMYEKDIPWNLGRAPYPYAVSDAEGWIKSATSKRLDETEYSFAVDLPSAGLIGSAGLIRYGETWELGYWIGKPYWGKGYVTEAAAGVMNWARTRFGAAQFMAGHYVDNPASGAVLMKLGFKPVGVTEQTGVARGFASPAQRYTCGASAKIALKYAHHG